jgi:hypothetical protein
MQSSGAGIDTAFQFYPTDAQQQPQTSPAQGQQLPDRDAQQQQSPQEQADIKYAFGDSVFMGANTPGR